jgi:hypothetical protein
MYEVKDLGKLKHIKIEDHALCSYLSYVNASIHEVLQSERRVRGTTGTPLANSQLGCRNGGLHGTVLPSLATRSLLCQ